MSVKHFWLRLTVLIAAMYVLYFIGPAVKDVESSDTIIINRQEPRQRGVDQEEKAREWLEKEYPPFEVNTRDDNPLPSYGDEIPGLDDFGEDPLPGYGNDD